MSLLLRVCSQTLRYQSSISHQGSILPKSLASPARLSTSTLSKPGVFQLGQCVKCRHSNYGNSRRFLGRGTGSSRSSQIQKGSSQALGRIGFLGRPLAFTFLVSGVSFTGCTIWQYESLRTLYTDIDDQNRNSFYRKAGSWRNSLNRWWSQMSPGQRLAFGIIGLNGLVCLMWTLVPLQGVMSKYFTSGITSGAPCWSMLLSTFSHRSFLHFAVNSYVLWSFASPVTTHLGREQFLAVYITAGMVSSFTSYFHKAVIGSAVVSLGASGAIMAMIGITCMQFPDARLSIVLVDQIFPHSFSAETGMKGIILLDTLGILFRWKVFDHAAHLGGMLFGLWYVKYGNKMIWRKREGFLKWWHKVRGKP